MLKLAFIATNRKVIMLIKSLEKMETIVDNNKFLSWDGWTVVELRKSAMAWMKPNAKFINNDWYTANRFDADADGWNIPASLVKKNAK
jgi:hypothetical protein